MCLLLLCVQSIALSLARNQGNDDSHDDAHQYLLLRGNARHARQNHFGEETGYAKRHNHTKRHSITGFTGHRESFQDIELAVADGLSAILHTLPVVRQNCDVVWRGILCWRDPSILNSNISSAVKPRAFFAAGYAFGVNVLVKTTGAVVVQCCAANPVSIANDRIFPVAISYSERYGGIGLDPELDGMVVDVEWPDCRLSASPESQMLYRRISPSVNRLCRQLRQLGTSLTGSVGGWPGISSRRDSDTRRPVFVQVHVERTQKGDAENTGDSYHGRRPVYFCRVCHIHSPGLFAQKTLSANASKVKPNMEGAV
jgi:hypothetical protein